MSPSVALAGNPNSGKTTLFNRLTGLNQRVGNYPGVTVERRSGRGTIGGAPITVVDLPGTYSLISRSRDEAVAFEVLTGAAGEARPELVVFVADASNLDRNLYLALQILELGLPMVVALNMIDLATARGLEPDPTQLAEALGVPVVPIIAVEGRGLPELERAIGRALGEPPTPAARAFRLSSEEEAAIAEVASAVLRVSGGASPDPLAATRADGEAIWLLSSLTVAERAGTRGTDEDPLLHLSTPGGPVAKVEIERALRSARARLTAAGSDFAARVIEARYSVATRLSEPSAGRSDGEAHARANLTDRLDAVLLHPVFGALLFVLVMGILFQSIYAWAEPLMGLIESGVALAQGAAAVVLPEGALRDLLADGVIGGAGNVLVFIPQIAILFFFIAILEDSGYLARAAFITDRLMAKAGLHGRAFVPLLSGFACAVPAIMAARTIESRKDRLVTILVTPLMSCSARLPVYAVVLSALFAGTEPVLGFLSAGGLILFSLYALSVATTIGAAFVLKRTLLVSPAPPFVLELPPYRRPALSSVLRRVLERCRVFVRDAGTVIVACSIVLWAMLYFPRVPAPDRPAQPSAITGAASDVADVAHGEDGAHGEEAIEAERLRSSYAGRLGRAIEPVIAPLGFDWKIGVGILASFAAREVFVSTMGLVYGVGRDADEESVPLREAMARERHPETGRPLYTPASGLALCVFFLFACQCMSTVAVVRRETGSWRWPAFMVVYMSALAWIGAFAVYQAGRALGFA